jgi:hypothetical protein
VQIETFELPVTSTTCDVSTDMKLTLDNVGEPRVCSLRYPTVLPSTRRRRRSTTPASTLG